MNIKSYFGTKINIPVPQLLDDIIFSLELNNCNIHKNLTTSEHGYASVEIEDQSYCE